jgi:phenolic acid decarboxylase
MSKQESSSGTIFLFAVSRQQLRTLPGFVVDEAAVVTFVRSSCP